LKPPLVRPDGGTFLIRANGVRRRVRCWQPWWITFGNWCPLDSHNITFSVSSLGNYRGGADNYVNGPANLSDIMRPLDHELRAEGGLCKVAIRSMFTQGTVTVTATSPGLGQGTTSFTVYPLDAITIAQGQSHPIVETALRQTLKTAAVGSTLRYFISSPANVAVDILDAKRKNVESRSQFQSR